MTEAQAQILKLALATKSVPGPIADLVIDYGEAVEGALSAFTQRQHAETLRAFAQTAKICFEAEGHEQTGDLLLRIVAMMVNESIAQNAEPESDGG